MFCRPALLTHSQACGVSLLQQLAAFRNNVWMQGVLYRFSIPHIQGDILAKLRARATGSWCDPSERLAALSFFARMWSVVNPPLYGKRASILNVRDVLNLWGNMMTDSSNSPQRSLGDIGLAYKDGSHASVNWGKHLLLQYLADVLGDSGMVQTCS